MKKWFDADIICIKISDTMFSETVAPDFDGQYVGDGIQGFMEEEDGNIEEIPEEEVALAFGYETDVLSWLNDS